MSLGVSGSGGFDSMLDYAPDEYIYSYPNGGGSFLFWKGCKKPIPYLFKKIKIKNLDETVHLMVQLFSSTQGIEITDENGNIFRYSDF